MNISDKIIAKHINDPQNYTIQELNQKVRELIPIIAENKKKISEEAIKDENFSEYEMIALRLSYQILDADCFFLSYYTKILMGRKAMGCIVDDKLILRAKALIQDTKYILEKIDISKFKKAAVAAQEPRTVESITRDFEKELKALQKELSETKGGK